MNTKQPQPLQKGDIVAIVATARKINRKDLQFAVELLENWGLNVVFGKTIGLDCDQYAGEDADRIIDFQQAIDDASIKAIWCARGGYGTVRMIDAIDFSNFIENPKWVIGFSDPTVIHSHLHTLGVQTLHAIMPITVEKATDDAKNSLKNALFGKANTYEVLGHSSNKKGAGIGELVGGNLSVLYSLLGSKSAITTDGKILFIEDLDEYLYHIDRMMLNLKRNGYLNNLKGLIIGGMTKMHDNTIPFGKNAKEIILDAVSDYSYPVCFDFPAGHMRDNRCLVMGKKMILKVGEAVTLEEK